MKPQVTLLVGYPLSLQNFVIDPKKRLHIRNHEAMGYIS